MTSFAAAAEIEQRIGSEPLLARTRTWWARCLLQRGAGHDAADAVRLLRQANATAGGVGMTALEAETRLLLDEVSA